MYEHHFGLSGPAFQLNPDPGFYYDSPAHEQALADLRYGAFRAEGFIVFVGEPGVGKTTVVKKLLAELKQDQVVAAHLMSLPSGESALLESILSAYGLPVAPGLRPQNLAVLEAHLHALAARKQRALLVVDEAQNLSRAALLELRAISNLKLDAPGLMQVFLVGQPELARNLNASSLAPLRQHVTASSRLRPLDTAETQAYIKHRLRRVGWTGNPPFDPSAFEAIHSWTEGVPRRINQLCDRIMLAASLSDRPHVTGAMVGLVAQEQRTEFGGLPDEPSDELASALSWQPAAVQSSKAQAPVVCIVGTVADLLKARVLNRQLQGLGGVPDLVIVSPLAPADTPTADADGIGLPASHLEMHLAVHATGYARSMAEVLRRFDALVEVLLPGAALVLGDSDATLACTLVAQRRGLSVARIDGGMRTGSLRDPNALNAMLIDRQSHIVFAPMLAAAQALKNEGVPEGQVHQGGSPVVDLAALVDRQPALLRGVLQRCHAGDTLIERRTPFVLATMKVWSDDPWPDDVADILGAMQARAPVLWLLDGPSRKAMAESGFDEHVRGLGIVLVPDAGYLEQLALMRQALAVVIDTSRELAAEAQVLGLPLVLFDAYGMAAQMPQIAASAVVEDGEDASHALEVLLARAEFATRGVNLGTSTQVATQLKAWFDLAHTVSP